VSKELLSLLEHLLYLLLLLLFLLLLEFHLLYSRICKFFFSCKLLFFRFLGFIFGVLFCFLSFFVNISAGWCLSEADVALGSSWLVDDGTHLTDPLYYSYLLFLFGCYLLLLADLLHLQ